MCFKNVIAPTNREKKIITYFLIVHPRGTHAENSTTTMKIGRENKNVKILEAEKAASCLKLHQAKAKIKQKYCEYD